ncbi:dTDP-4-amino-4,6-dideoxygalactose transaminase [Salinimicrobium soli]|uniref:dTDP-4-amino-4,6-dideoxygalactose transaminase n=1 Tax=Salinimicrobium soli TaxID=1254399 RepID=UPI003AABE4E5
MDWIPFNKPYLTGNELSYVQDAVREGKISSNGKYTQLCQNFFQKRYKFGKCFLTTSCTDALEMATLLISIKPGDEVILPSYTFVSTANAFALRGAKLIFVDSRKDHPGIDEDKIEDLITNKTKVIVPVHYGGVACDMDKIMALAAKYQLIVVEDAAHAIDSFYIGKDGVKKALGSIGHFATFSFHETKNITSGEGGMLVINDSQYLNRAEIIWEKGTNRSSLFRQEVKKYEWLDLGSSYAPSEILAAFLWAQLENLQDIQKVRLNHWNTYYEKFENWAFEKKINLPIQLQYTTRNGHMFYLVLKSENQRQKIIDRLKEKNILAVFHYLSLHKSPFFNSKHDGRILPEADRYSENLLRLPFYYTLSKNEIQHITEIVKTQF